MSAAASWGEVERVCVKEALLSSCRFIPVSGAGPEVSTPRSAELPFKPMLVSVGNLGCRMGALDIVLPSSAVLHASNPRSTS